MLASKLTMQRTLLLVAFGVVVLGGSLLYIRHAATRARQERQHAANRGALQVSNAPVRSPSDAAQPVATPASAKSQTAASNQYAVDQLDAVDRLFADALRNTDRDSRRMALRAIAELLAKNDPEKAKDYIAVILNLRDAHADGDAYAFTTTFCDTFAARDPHAATVWCDVLPDRLKEVAFQFTARHWIGRDAKAASEWVSSLGSPTLRATAIRSISNQLLHSDPTNFAAQWAANLARSQDGPRFSEIVVQHWAKAEPAAAAEWAARLSDASERDGAFVALAAVLAEKDAAAAVQWTANMPHGELRSRMLQETVARWAARDPASAAAWLNGHSSERGLLEASLPHIAPAWLQKDRVAATRWIESAPVNTELKNYLLTVWAEQSDKTR